MIRVIRPFEVAQIEALGPPPAPPIPARLRIWNGGRVNAPDRIWTAPIVARLHRAYAIGARAGVVAAFPGWEQAALFCAIRRCGSAPIHGAPAPFDRREFVQRLHALPATDVIEGVRMLMTWGPAAVRSSDLERAA